MARYLFTDGEHPAARCLTEALLSRGDEVFFCEEDISTLEGIRACVKRVGGVGHLIVCGMPRGKGTLRTREARDLIGEADRLIMSAFSACRHFGTLMAERGQGTILFLSSTCALKPLGADLAYSVSQGALLMMQKELSLFFGNRGVRVNTVLAEPLEEQAGHFESAYLKTDYDVPTKSPLRRRVTAREVADVCLFLMGDAASGVNGEAVRVDGGLEHYYFDRDYAPVKEADLL